MSAIEEVLWNIFTHYSLNGNPKDPSRLHSMGLKKFCADIMVFENLMTESPINLAEMNLIYASTIKNPKRVISYFYF